MFLDPIASLQGDRRFPVKPGMTFYRLDFFDRSVVFLEALHSTVAVAGGSDALDGVVGTGERRDVRNLVLDGGLADSAFVLDGVALCPRRVDDEVHLLVQDDIENVRAAFSNLVHHFALDTGGFVELGGTFGSVNLEAELLEFLADFDGLFRQVNLVGQADKHGTFVREEGTCGFLALVVSEGVVVGEAEDFAGGAHFGAENRVHLREPHRASGGLRGGPSACYKPWRPEAPCGMRAGSLRGRTPCRLRWRTACS